MAKNTDDMTAVLAACKFYKGEKKNPFEDNRLLDKNGEYMDPLDRDRASLWFYELKFVEMRKTPDGIKILIENLDEYKAYNGKKLAGISDQLLALLFNRYFHWSSSSPSDPASMNEFYKFVKTFY